jgi:CheY-like chemotaxis protein
MTILYVDDDAEDRELFQEAVHIIDPTIICNVANDGQHGLDTLEQLIVTPDIIFLDVNMPVMNGRQFLETIRKTIRLRSIPVVMYSTTSASKEISDYKSLGARDFVVKPSSFDGVCKALRKFIVSEMPSDAPSYRSNASASV